MQIGSASCQPRFRTSLSCADDPGMALLQYDRVVSGFAELEVG